MISPRQFLIAVTIAFFGSAASAAENCATVLAAPPAVLQRPLVVLGELHGTAQTVALAGDLVCAKAIRDEEVILALEVPDSEQARLSAFLESHGTQGDEIRRAEEIENRWSLDWRHSATWKEVTMGLLDQLGQAAAGMMGQAGD